jgi:hypothetical protein
MKRETSLALLLGGFHAPAQTPPHATRIPPPHLQRAPRTTGRPELQTQVRLLRDGRPVYTMPLQAYDPGPQKDPSNVQAGGRLQLGATLRPGDYVLQVVVADAPAKGKARTATQWMDFEIVK